MEIFDLARENKELKTDLLWALHTIIDFSQNIAEIEYAKNSLKKIQKTN